MHEYMGKHGQCCCWCVLVTHTQVMSGIHEHLPEVVGLDVDLASTAAATAALADADRLMAGGVTSNSGGRGMAQYVPACVLAAARLAKREGGGMGGSYNLSWPRAQVRGFCSPVFSALCLSVLGSVWAVCSLDELPWAYHTWYCGIQCMYVSLSHKCCCACPAG